MSSTSPCASVSVACPPHHDGRLRGGQVAPRAPTPTRAAAAGQEIPQNRPRMPCASQPYASVALSTRARSSLGENGFVRYSSAPQSGPAPTSDACALEVSRITNVRESMGSRLIARASSSPVGPGIWTSNTTTDGLCSREPLPSVLADPDKLDQILINLISNAIKYSPQGGPVRISAEPADGGVRFSVADHGLGIAPGDLPQLFGRFHRIPGRAHRRIGGTGLGLYITKQLVELQGAASGPRARGRGAAARFGWSFLRASRRRPLADRVRAVFPPGRALLRFPFVVQPSHLCSPQRSSYW